MRGDSEADLLFGTTVERAVTRSTAFYDTAEIEISDWLNDRPEIRRISDIGSGWESRLLTNRISNHSERGLNLSIPSGVKINFATSPHDFILPDLVLTDAVIIIINRRTMGSFIPSPNFPPEDRTADCTIQESIDIAILAHSTIAGRLGDRTFAGPGYIVRLGSAFGARVVGLRTNPHHNLAALVSSREFIGRDELPSDFRRHSTAFASFSQFLGMVEVVFH